MLAGDSLVDLHRNLRSRAVGYFRTREILRVFEATHRDELAHAPIQSWPQLQAKHKQEVSLIKAGQFDITDRRSWQWPWLPSNVTRFSIPVAKFLPYSIRRMAKTPIARRAINLIKNAVTAQVWEIRVRDDVDPIDNFADERIRIAKSMFTHPNNTDSWQMWIERGIEDLLITGSFIAELRRTPDPDRPLKSWIINSESMRLFPNWSEATPDAPRFVQMTGLKGERGAILFYEDEILFIPDNPSTDNPYGLGKMEVCFQMINALLGVHAMCSRAGTDQVHKSWLWWEQPQSIQAYNIIRRHIQNEVEGQARVSMIGGMQKPEVIEIQALKEEDLLLGWQEMVLRVIAAGFDLSPLSLGVERDVNRSTSETLDDKDFYSAVVPLATRLQEAFTGQILHEKLGWTDLEFVFPNLNQPNTANKMEMNSQLFVANAMTPNEIRTSMGMRPQENPFYDLNSFEQQLLLAQAQADLQDRNANNQGVRQAAQQSQMLDRQQKFQKEQSDQAADQQQENAGPLAASAAPYRRLVAGTQYTAEELRAMDLTTFARLLTTGQLPKPKRLLRNLQLAGVPPPAQFGKKNGNGNGKVVVPDGQKPGGSTFLQQLGDEVRTFLEAVVKDQAAHPKKTVSQAVRDQWAATTLVRFRQDALREHDFEKWVYQNVTPAGRPGTLNKRSVGNRRITQ